MAVENRIRSKVLIKDRRNLGLLYPPPPPLLIIFIKPQGLPITGKYTLYVYVRP